MPDEFALSVAAGTFVFAGALRGFTGFAGPMLALPVMIALYGPVPGAVTVMLVDLTSAIALLPGTVRLVEWRLVTPLALGTALTLPLGSLAVETLDPEIVRPAILAVIFLLAALMLFGWRYERALRRAETFCLGAVSGLLFAGTTVGALVPLLLFAGPSSVEEARADAIMWLFMATAIIVAILGLAGYVTQADLMRAALLAPGYLVAAWFGARGFRGADKVSFRRLLLLTLVGVSGTVLLSTLI